MSWAAIAAKNKDKPVSDAESKEVVRAKGEEGEVEEEVPVEEIAKTMEPVVVNAPVRRVLVLDTGALIHEGGRLAEMADDFVTTPDVLREARDRKTKEYLESFPFEIQIREPTKESVKEAIRFSKLTGDYGALSSTDMRIVALTHTISEEYKCLVPIEIAEGATMLRPKINMSMPKKKRDNQKPGGVQNLPGWGSWSTKEEEEKEEKEEEEEEGVDGAEEGDDAAVLKTGGDGNGEEEEVADAVEVDGGWITKENINEFKGDGVVFGLTSDGRNVGCMTTDFAMQNVLMHMGAAVVSVEGYRMKHLRKWVLRCFACYALVKDTSRQFCPKCGSGDTLKRVSYSINDKGEEEIWINPKRRINIRGTIHPLPKPRGGRNGTNRTCVLREDQLLNCGRTDKLNRDREDRLATMLSEKWMFAGESRDKKSTNHIKPTVSAYNQKKAYRH